MPVVGGQELGGGQIVQRGHGDSEWNRLGFNEKSPSRHVACDGLGVGRTGPAASVPSRAGYAQYMDDRSLTKIGMSFHRPRTFLAATVIHCGWYR
ncbi:hypothetical protein D3C72_2099650 [compost metagenome]